MDIFVTDGYSEDALTLDAQTLVGDLKQRMKVAPWEHELLLNDATLPIECSLVAAGTSNER